MFWVRNVVDYDDSVRVRFLLLKKRRKRRAGQGGLLGIIMARAGHVYMEDIGVLYITTERGGCTALCDDGCETDLLLSIYIRKQLDLQIPL